MPSSRAQQDEVYDSEALAKVGGVDKRTRMI
jgi:hypothetical protein